MTIVEGSTVFVLGYPQGLGGIERNFTIVRRGSVARIRDWLAGHSPLIMVDAQIFPRTASHSIRGELRSCLVRADPLRLETDRHEPSPTESAPQDPSTTGRNDSPRRACGRSARHAARDRLQGYQLGEMEPRVAPRHKKAGIQKTWKPALFREWPRPESNWRHCDFQSHALPTELQGHGKEQALVYQNPRRDARRGVD